LTGGRTAADWRDDAGRLQAGGPIAVPFQAGGLRAYAAAHDADPQGRWLMAAVAVHDLSPAHRRVFVDAARWNAVVGDFVHGTSAADASDHMSTLADQGGPTMMKSDSIQVDVSSIGAGGSGTVSIDYLSDHGYPQTAHVKVGHTGSVTAALPSCRVGCALLSVTLAGDPFDVSTVTAGKTRLLGSASHDEGAPDHALTVVAGDAPVAALTTPGLLRSSVVDGIDGDSHPVHVVGSVGAVPFVGRAGSLLDLRRVLRGAAGTVAAARSVVLARADTPADVLARLHEDGGGKPTTYTAVADRLDSTPQARADSLALLVAVGVGLVALTHLLAWLAGQVGRRRTEVAGLRVAGIGPHAVRRAYVVEAVMLASVVMVAAAIAAVATTIPLLKPMELVGGWGSAPVLVLEIRPFTLGGVVLGIALLTAALCAFVFTRFGRAARPAALRSAEQ